MRMGKRGEKLHTKRVAVPKAVPIHDKKGRTWIADTGPGTHSKKRSMSLVVLLREVLGSVKTSKEAKIALGSRRVLVDGAIRTDHRFPVGFMDIISVPEADEYYRIGIKRGKLSPVKIGKDESSSKLLKVTGKKTLKGNKISLSFHDGRNLPGDNNARVGDSVEYDFSGGKILRLLKFRKGSKCIITEGKHSGAEVVVEEIYPNNEGRDAEALVSSGEKSFRTLAGYLFVVGE